jgi:hypothetical protein
VELLVGRTTLSEQNIEDSVKVNHTVPFFFTDSISFNRELFAGGKISTAGC